jgi:hypothetical protein
MIRGEDACKRNANVGSNNRTIFHEVAPIHLFVPVWGQFLYTGSWSHPSLSSPWVYICHYPFSILQVHMLSSLDQSHQHNQYPLIFLLFKKEREKNLLDHASHPDTSPLLFRAKLLERLVYTYRLYHCLLNTPNQIFVFTIIHLPMTRANF